LLSRRRNATFSIDLGKNPSFSLLVPFLTTVTAPSHPMNLPFLSPFSGQPDLRTAATGLFGQDTGDTVKPLMLLEVRFLRPF